MKKYFIIFIAAFLLILSSTAFASTPESIGIGITINTDDDSTVFGILGMVPLNKDIVLSTAYSSSGAMSAIQLGTDWCLYRFKRTNLGVLGRIINTQGLGESLTGYAVGGWLKSHLYDSVNPLGMKLKSYLTFDISLITMPGIEMNATKFNIGLFDEIGENIFWDFKVGKSTENDHWTLYSCFGVYL